MREVSGELFSYFNRTAPQHTGIRHCATTRATPAFIPPDLWPANSPDLNPVDYRIWSIIQQRVYQSRLLDTDELKQCVQQMWRNVDQSITDNALTSGTSVSCMRAGERWTLRVYAVKQYAYLQSTVRQHKRFIFVKYDTLFDFFFCCNLQ